MCEMPKTRLVCLDCLSAWYVQGTLNEPMKSTKALASGTLDPLSLCVFTTYVRKHPLNEIAIQVCRAFFV